MKEITVSTTKRYELVDITEYVEKVVEQSGVGEGIVLVFTPHSTAGVLITENEDNLKSDWLRFFEKMVEGIDFKHNQIDDNADSHILSGLLGQGRTLIVENGRVVRGTWQRVFLVEFDGPRNRRVLIEIIKAK